MYVCMYIYMYLYIFGHSYIHTLRREHSFNDTGYNSQQPAASASPHATVPHPSQALSPACRRPAKSAGRGCTQREPRYVPLAAGVLTVLALGFNSRAELIKQPSLYSLCSPWCPRKALRKLQLAHPHLAKQTPQFISSSTLCRCITKRSREICTTNCKGL